MALIQKTNPVGIDVVIDRIQSEIYNNIFWATDYSYESYHRAYKNETNNALIWEVFDGVNDYKEVLMDDTFDATSFWVVEDTISYGDLWTASVSVIFQLNLETLYPAINHRADEEAHNDIATIVQENVWDYKLSSMVKGIRNVYSELGYGANVFDDMQPYHVFRLNFDVEFTQDCCVDC